jgi:hypothetical protein
VSLRGQILCTFAAHLNSAFVIACADLKQKTGVRFKTAQCGFSLTKQKTVESRWFSVVFRIFCLIFILALASL